MRRLTLMRHADARWNDSGVSDLERPLNRRGTGAAEAMARRLGELRLVPELVLVSPARRAQQTAEIMARELSLPVRLLVREEGLYLAAPPELLRLVRGAGPLVQHLMVLGHNPGLTELAHELAPRQAPRELSAAALCSMEFGCAGWGEIGAACLHSARHEHPPARLFGLFA
jgi:phosphohistidine phosphatase